MSNKKLNIKKGKVRVIAGVLCLAMIAGCFVGIMGKKNHSVEQDDSSVTLGDYKNISIEMAKLEPTEEQIDQYAAVLVGDYNEIRAIDREKIKFGDTVYVTMSFYDKNDDIIGDTGTNGKYITMGAGQIDKTVEKKLMTRNIAHGTLKMDIDHPTYGEVTCEITPEYIINGDPVTMNTLTDEQARDLLDMDFFHLDDTEKYSGIDGVYQYAKDSLVIELEDQMKMNAQTIIEAKLLETCSVNAFPYDDFQARADEYMEGMEESCKIYYNMTLDEWLETIGMTKETYRGNIEAELADMIKLELIFIAIADKEYLGNDEDGYLSYVDETYVKYGYESVEAFYEDNTEEKVRKTYRIECAEDWVVDHADITYLEEENVNE